MEYVELGRTGLPVSRICLGTWQFTADWGEPDVAKCRAVIRRALELGINFFDTAQAYGFGRAEEILGEALAQEVKMRRAEIFIATKGGMRITSDGRLVRDSTPAWLRAGLEDSLRFLNTDYVDLYQLHWPDPTIPFSETAGLLRQFVEEGKVRYIGVSNFDVGQMVEFGKGHELDTLQPPYSLLRRDVAAEILPYCAEHNIGVLVYSALAHGLLGGNLQYDEKFPANDWRSTSPNFEGPAFRKNLGVVQRLKELAKERGCSTAQLAVAWVLSHSAVHVAIMGARSPEKLDGTAAAASIRLSPEDLQTIEEIVASAIPVAPPGEVPGLRDT
jgi:aryl-alcohol dehydrogenase-like predicted oxidoreductase